VARHAALRFNLVHAASLERRRLLAGLLDFEKHCPALLQAQQVRNASKLMRPAVNLHDPPSGFFGCPNYRRDDAGFERHSFAISTALPLKQRRHDSHTRTIESLRLRGQS
jgi:hypothetical protein